MFAVATSSSLGPHVYQIFSICRKQQSLALCKILCIYIKGILRGVRGKFF